MLSVLLFFFKQKTAYEMRISDWSSDVCSSYLNHDPSSVSTASIACRQSPISRVSVACAAGWHGAHCPFHLSCFAPLMLHTRPRGTVLLERISQMKGSMAEDDCCRRCSS